MNKLKVLNNNLQVNKISKSFGNKQVVRHISLNINRGEIVGLLGPNGAGKTTTVEILEGLIKSTSGEAFINNLDVRKDSKLVKKIIGETNTYLTFDIDGIDPTFAPGTGTPEVGGYNVRESQLIIRSLNQLNFIGADLVEISPPFDINNMTSLVGANMAFEILCTMTKTN